MMCSTGLIAQEGNEAGEPFENIVEVDEGYLLTGEQIISLANYIQELETKVKKLEAQLEEAHMQLEKITEENKYNNMIMRLGDGLTGAGLAALIITLFGSQ